ncbi:hypothetical protein [Franzmannia qiaohouensis]|uniref:Uncharacterized protein n=1 Tax=Franzmannia qiaohouensis TaxID=1329370 RepID=A0ABU1HJ94_9GAMM|nr:hypothetical protein [Halomonas qiaohouensis]MDR5907543.1 hypothetical protein [Halomonas qiaohouensis]
MDAFEHAERVRDNSALDYRAGSSSAARDRQSPPSRRGADD